MSRSHCPPIMMLRPRLDPMRVLAWAFAVRIIVSQCDCLLYRFMTAFSNHLSHRPAPPTLSRLPTGGLYVPVVKQPNATSTYNK